MKTLIELNIPQIKCVNKETTDYVRDLQQRANDELYPYRQRPLSPDAAIALIKILTDVGVALSSAIVSEKQALRRNEIQEQLRSIIRQLKAYVGSLSWENEDVNKVQRIMNYFTQKVIQAKQKGLTTKDVVILLRERKVIDKYYIVPLYKHINCKLNHDSYCKTENDLLGWFYGEWSGKSDTPVEVEALPFQKVTETFKKQTPKPQVTTPINTVPSWVQNMIIN
jgi:hypothetical protein